MAQELPSESARVSLAPDSSPSTTFHEGDVSAIFNFMENDQDGVKDGRSFRRFVSHPSRETETAGSSGLSFPAAPEKAARQRRARVVRQ